MNPLSYNSDIERFTKKLWQEEKSENTISKYRRDVLAFLKYLPSNSTITKEIVLQYKHYLEKQYAVASVNSMLVALNQFLTFLGFSECRVKLLKIQRRIFRDKHRELPKEEYKRLLEAAEKSKKYSRTGMILQTLCGVGLRVSELRFITVEAAQAGVANITCKGKSRVVSLPRQLQKKLLHYCKERHITKGSIFITKTGKPIHRTNIWKLMKQLCEIANVARERVYPHNLRHLFAVTYYNQNRSDIMGLADILGHSSIETTRIYIATNEGEFNRRMERLGLIV